MEAPMPGTVTGADLTDVAPLLQPWTQDPWGRLRPPVSMQAMRLSAELATAAYAMAAEEWIAAGWQDVTIQVDGRLTPLSSGDSRLTARWKKHRVHARIRGSNPVSQVVGALRQRESSTTGKALVMIRPAPDGRYVVAIGFMGTGRRFYDWFSNFRVATPEGVHKGFAQLTTQFEENEDRIEFPETAAALGLEKLTLRHVLEDMKRPDSRFLLWLTGHSQGSALMQVYAHRKIMNAGVLPANVVGYGFASPTVMTGTAVAQPEAYPLYHVNNSDDLVSRCGAQVHLGVCLTYTADEALRRQCYAWPRDRASVEARRIARGSVRCMTDTPSCIVQGLAYLKQLEGVSASEIAAMLGLDSPLNALLNVTDAQEVLAGVIRRVERAYQSITGAPPDAEMLAQAMDGVRQGIEQVGLKRYTDALRQLIRWPHHIRSQRAPGYLAAYAYIVRQEADRLSPSIWRSGETPVRLGVPSRTNEQE